MFSRSSKPTKGAGETVQKEDARSALEDVKARVAELQRVARLNGLGKRAEVLGRRHGA